MAHVVNDRDGIATRALADCTELYDAEIAYVDAQIGVLVAGLDEIGRLDGAIVIFTADHGENLGEQGLFYQHGPSLHSASLRVPLVIVAPRIPARRDDRVVGLEDVMPTLLTLLDWPRAAPSRDGRSRSRARARVAADGPAPRLRGERQRAPGGIFRAHHLRSRARPQLHARPALLALQRARRAAPPLRSPRRSGPHGRRRRPPSTAGRDAAGTARRVAAGTGATALGARPSLQAGGVSGAAGGYRRALYDLRSDPAEELDRADEFPAIAERLGARLDGWTAQLPPSWSSPLSKDALEALRALGYLQ